MQQEQITPVMVSVKTAGRMLELCDAEVRKLIAEGKLTAMRLGTRHRISVRSIHQLADGPLQGQEAK